MTPSQLDGESYSDILDLLEHWNEQSRGETTEVVPLREALGEDEKASAMEFFRKVNGG